MAQQMGSALLQKGVPPNEQGMVGIFAGNCVEVSEDDILEKIQGAVSI